MPCKPMSCQCGNFYVSQRFIQAFLCFWAIIMLFNMRSCLNLVINKMVKKKAPNITEETKSEFCARDEKNETEKAKSETRDWSDSMQSFIKASFYIGYVPAHLPAGILADRCGGRRVMLLSMLVSSLLTLILPVLVHYGGGIVVGISRILVGVSQGICFPAVSALLAKWVPKKQRAFLGSFAMSGSHIGTITGNALSGLMTEQFQDWSVSFYVWGVLGLGFCGILLTWCWAVPSDSPFILDEEKEYLLAEMPPKKEKLKTPIKAIILDLSVFAMSVGQFGHAWVFFTFNTDLPKYLDEVLAFNIQSNGFINALPSLFMWISSIIASLFSDWLYTHRHVRILTLRRWFTVFGNIVPALICVAVPFMGCNKVLAVSMLTATLAAKGPFYCGIKVNYLDITNNFAGMVCALNNGAAAIAGFITPYTITLVAPNHRLTEWKYYFFLSLGITVVSTVFYFIFAKDERRKWDYVGDEKPPEPAPKPAPAPTPAPAPAAPAQA